MTTLSHMKGVRTRYRNTLYAEIQEGNSILHAEISKPHRQEMVHKSAKCIEKLKVYISKLEIQSSKVASSLEEDQSGIADKLADEDCKLCSDATDCYLELENFKERLVDNIKLETTENVEKVNPSDFIQLQQEMKDIIQTQLKQQENFIKSQQKSESVETNVKLPKIDIISFNGDKTKWNEFWDSFESTIDQNKRLSNIDKFNYLKSKLVGDAKYAISGLNVSHENYIVAVNILKERFGNTQDVIDLHYCEMINLQCPSNKTYSLRLFIDKVNRHLRSLEVLKQSVDQDIFVSMVRSKLPQEVMLQLEIQKGTTEKWCVKSLCARLMDYVVAKERSDKSDVQKDRQNSQNNNGVNSLSKRNQFQGKFSKFQNGSRQFPNRSTAEALVVNGNDTSQSSSYFDKCRFCQGKHWSDQCPKYKTIDERKAQLKGSCYKCFRNTHKSAECKKGKLCVHCGVLNSHHRSLCPKKFGSGLTTVHLSEEYGHSSSILSSGVEQSLTSLSEQRETASENVLISSSEIVLMQTAKVEVSNTNDSLKQTTRLLFDSGSQRTYISQQLASKLKLKSEGDEEISIVTFGSEKARTVKTASTSLCIRLNNGKVLKISANIVPVISGTVQRRRLDTSSIENVRHFVKDVELADVIPTQYETSTVDLLIGNDHYFDFILGQRIEIQPGLYLLASKLGWIITGRTKENDYSREDSESSFLIMSYTGSNVPVTDTCITSVPNVTDLWNLESIGISDDDNSTEDSRVLKMFKETLEYSNGRYYVTWPWKNDNVDLPVNRDLALSRLKSCIARMRKKPELLEKYNSVIQDQLDKGIVEMVEEHSTEGLKHYIPHHAVITPNKTTTKLRIVYDASAKPNNEVKSLNECLYRGPVLLRNLCGIFMRFRLNQVAVVADIEKAFLQVGLQKGDRDVTRFLWLKNYNDGYASDTNLQEYRFCRVPFGIISSPFLLAATVESHLDKYQSPISRKIKDNIYVDNLISGCTSVAESLEFYSEAKHIFQNASMNLREWVSSSKSFNELLPTKDRTDVFETCVLGHLWNTDIDVIYVKSAKNTMCSGISTKRKTLSELAEVFDPMGFFSPVIVSGKIFLQDLWKRNLKWDDEICGDDKLKWISISSELKKISDVSIPRFIGLEAYQNNVKYKLLCFCDASKRAYSTAIYLHQSSGDATKCDLIFSKSRLAPIQGMTIPKLELMAVLVGVRSLKFVKTELKLVIDKTFLWTDSQCVLKWLSTKKSLRVFVENRVQEIKSHKDISFMYVSTKENPADVATRGTLVQKLRSDHLWWHGPSWLKQDENTWEKIYDDDDANQKVNDQFKSELKTSENQNESAFVSENGQEITSNKMPYNIDIKRFSSYHKLIRVTAWIERFISKIRRIPSNNGKYLSVKEIEIAEEMWIQSVQRKSFADVFNSIHTGQKNNLKVQLGVYLDNENLLRCKGRFENADISECAKFPILLPRGETFTRLLVEKTHKELFHSGVSHTLCRVRNKFWIPQGRATVRQILRHCKTCKRFEGGPFKMPNMAPFPRSRVSRNLPFQGTGLDYLGPVYVKDDTVMKKRWICLFTCFVTRAIHLEIVNDMTTEEFICAFRRFVSTRGTPSEVISDNASQFKLGSETIKSVWENTIIKNEIVQNYMSSCGIQWKFITELAPWMGGFYERLVGLVKRCLRKTLRKRSVSDVQLLTLMKEIEAVLNSRPLVYVDEELQSRTTLTPNHFLAINSQNGIPDVDYDLKDPSYKTCETSSEKLKKLWKKGQNILNCFWKTWREEYLLSLRERKQIDLKCGKVKSTVSPGIGSVVIIKEDLPRGMWKLGRIVKHIQSNDGQLRSVKVRLANGNIIGRPLNLLYPLEIDEISNDDSNSQDLATIPKEVEMSKRPIRTAAEIAKKKIQKLNL